MKKLIGLSVLGVLLLFSTPIFAQAPTRICVQNGDNCVDVSAGAPFPVNASVTASVTGFAPGGAFANLTSTASSADVALPTGAVVAAFNTGTTAVSCNLTVGAGTSVASKNVIQASSWFGFTVGSNTHISCINQAGDSASNVVVLSGGTGLPTGAGGGGGSSSNLSVGSTGSAVPASATYVGINSSGNLTGWTGAVTNAGTFAVQAAQSGTWNITNISGSVSLPTGAATSANQSGTSATTAHGCSVAGYGELGCLGQIDDDVKGPVPWLSSTAWNTNTYTNGTINPGSADLHGAPWVDIGAINGVAALAGAGATGTGSPRVTAAQDTTTIAGSAPGTAGTPSANVVSVQGEASMTPVAVSQTAFAETAASSGVLKASSGNLYTISVDAVTATTDLKLLLFNLTTLPVDGTVAPYKCVSFKGDGTQASFLLSWAPDALSFSTGISAAVSSATACTTKTNVTATISGQVQ